jgi:hypothetical protein
MVGVWVHMFGIFTCFVLQCVLLAMHVTLQLTSSTGIA